MSKPAVTRPDARTVLKDVFGYPAFRGPQADIVDHVTGGGDCPGLNAVIRAVVRKGETVYGDELVGFEDGWRGVIENRTMPLDVHAMRRRQPWMAA